MPTLKVCTGFEFGATTGLTTGANGAKLFDGSAGTPSVVSSGLVRTGTYCLELNPSAASEYVQWTPNTFGTGTVLVASFAILFPTSLPSGNVLLAYLQNSAATDSALWFRNSDSKLFVNHNDLTGTAAVGPVVAADTWYKIDVRYNVAAATHTVDWQVDGSAQTQFTGGGTAGTVTAFGFGDFFANQTVTFRVDDVAVSTTSGDYPLGAHKVVLLKPDTGATATEIGTANATGRMVTNNAIDATFNSANILAATSEGPPPLLGATASGLGQRTSGVGNACNLPMTTYTLAGGESISGLRVLCCAWANNATAAANQLGVRTHNGTTETTLFAAAAYQGTNSSTAPAWVCKMATVADFDTQTELDALAVRIGYSGDINPLPGVHAVYAEVAVKESTGGTATADLDQATETDSATSPTFTKTLTLGQSTETDTALGITATKAVTLGFATEADETFEAAFGATLDVELSQASETDTAQGLTASKALTLGLPTESDSSSSVSFTKTVILGQATETDAALGAAFGAAASFNLNQATETDSALTLTFARAITLGIAAETEAAASLSFAKVITLGLAAEADSAFDIEQVGETLNAQSAAMVTAARASDPRASTPPIAALVGAGRSSASTVGAHTSSTATAGVVGSSPTVTD